MWHWLVIVLALIVGGINGWYAREWVCKHTQRGCPIWQQERKLAWKAHLRKLYPNGSREHHPTPIDPAAPTGVISTERDEHTAETKPTPTRRT